MSHKKLLHSLLTFCILLLIIVQSSSFTFGAYQIRNTQKAETLKSLGLFSGTNAGFELEREATRAEGAIMLVRLLGKDSAAKAQKNPHPFKDVPLWADPYIGYLYKNGIVSGKSSKEFGSNDKLSLEQYLTFILRALGYDDKTGDFTWDHSVDKAIEIGLLYKTEINTIKGKHNFLRDDVVGISYNCLNINLKGIDKTLLQKLIEENVILKDVAIKNGVYNDNYISEIDTSDVKYGGISVVNDGWVYFSVLERYPALYRMKEDGTEITEISESITNLNIVGKFIFSEKYGNIYRMNLDGTNQVKLCDDLAARIHVVGNWIYYINYTDAVAAIEEGKEMKFIDAEDVKPGDNVWGTFGKLYKIRLDGSEKTRLTDFATQAFYVTDNYLYFDGLGLNNRGNALYQANLDGSIIKKVTDNTAGDFTEHEGSIYFDLTNGPGFSRIARMTPDGEITDQFETGNLKGVSFQNDYIYFKESPNYTWESPLYRMKYDRSEKTLLLEDKCYGFDITGSKVFYMADFDGKGKKVYRMNLDGSDKEVFDINKWDKVMD